MNLFLIVWEMQDQEVNWTHIVSDKPYLSTSDEENIIANYMFEEYDWKKAETIKSLQNFWSEKIDMVNGYTIELEKYEQIDPEAFNDFLGMNPEEELEKLAIRKDLITKSGGCEVCGSIPMTVNCNNANCDYKE